jgi:hypothetical protein
MMSRVRAGEMNGLLKGWWLPSAIWPATVSQDIFSPLMSVVLDMVRLPGQNKFPFSPLYFFPNKYCIIRRIEFKSGVCQDYS